MKSTTPMFLEGVLLDEQFELSLNDLCCACSSSAEWIIELVDEGALEPLAAKNVTPQTHYTQQNLWRFNGNSVQRVKTAKRLQNDLNINLAGIALALDLLDEINHLQTQLRCHNQE